MLQPDRRRRADARLLAFDAHEESSELIYLRADAIDAMRQEARASGALCG